MKFQKGQPPKNKVSVNTVTIRQHKGDSPRAWIKIAEPNSWTERAKQVWIQRNGNIPKGFVVHHINENTLDDDIKNLLLVSRAYHTHIHREKLISSKVGVTLSVKKTKCVKCGTAHESKRTGTMCNECRIIARRAAKSNYKQRIRLATRFAGESSFA